MDACKHCNEPITLQQIENTVYISAKHMTHERVRAEAECPYCGTKMDIELKVLDYERR